MDDIRTERKKLIKDVLVNQIAEIVLKFRGLIMMPLLTKSFTLSNYGAWSQFWVLYSFFSL